MPDSFNFAPTQIIPGADFDTLVWTRSLAFGEAAPTFNDSCQDDRLVTTDSTLGRGAGVVRRRAAGGGVPLDLVCGVR